MKPLTLGVASPIDRNRFASTCQLAVRQSNKTIKKISVNPRNFNEMMALGRKTTEAKTFTHKGIEINCNSKVDYGTLKFYFND